MEERADRATQPVHNGDRRIGDTNTCFVSSECHLAACLSVAAVGVDARQIGENALHRCETKEIALRIGFARSIGFDGVSERIHACGHGDALRHLQRKLRIDDCQCRHQSIATDQELFISCGISDDGELRCFRACTGCGWDADNWRNGTIDRAATERCDLFPRLRADSDGLRRIQRAAAAETDGKIALLLLINRQPGVDHRVRRFASDLGESRMTNTLLIEQRFKRGDVSLPDHRLAGDDQRFFTEPRKNRRCICQRIRANETVLWRSE